MDAPAETAPSAKPRWSRRRRAVVSLLIFAAVCAILYSKNGGCAHLGPPIPKINEATTRANFDYCEGATGDPRRQLDLRLPVGVANAPIVGILHGGAWTRGSRHEADPLSEWLAQRGVIGASIDYPLTPAATTVEQARDVARAAAWLARRAPEFGGDPQRVFLLGHSAGGHLAALVATDRHYLDAALAPRNVPAGVITVGAPFDLRDGANRATFSTRQMIRYAFGTDVHFLWNMSPQAHVHAGLPPFLIICAKADGQVSPSQADGMIAAIRAVGGSTETLTVSGRQHISVFDRMTQPGDQAAAAVLAFVTRKPAGPDSSKN